MKKFLVVLGMTSCLLGLTACSQNDVNANKPSFLYDETAYQTSLTEALNEYSSATDEQFAEYISEADSTGEAAFIEAWKNSRDEIGQVVGLSDWKFSGSEDGELVINVLVDGTLHDVDLKVVVDAENKIVYATPSVKYSLGEKMSKAGLNTVIGFGLVFVVLVFISWLIDMFKYVSVLEKFLADMKAKRAAKKAAKKAKKAGITDTTPVDNTIAQIVQKEEEEFSNDLELVAVIAAAIAAAEGTSPDGFVVRSIRKVNKNKWQNA